jgi:hypothetical protein
MSEGTLTLMFDKGRIMNSLLKREKIMLNLLIEYIDEIYAAREMRHEKVDDTFNFDLCRAEVVCARPADIFVPMMAPVPITGLRREHVKRA